MAMDDYRNSGLLVTPKHQVTMLYIVKKILNSSYYFISEKISQPTLISIRRVLTFDTKQVFCRSGLFWLLQEHIFEARAVPNTQRRGCLQKMKMETQQADEADM